MAKSKKNKGLDYWLEEREELDFLGIILITVQIIGYSALLVMVIGEAAEIIRTQPSTHWKLERIRQESQKRYIRNMECEYFDECDHLLYPELYGD